MLIIHNKAKAATATYQTIDRQVSSEPSAIKDKTGINNEPAQVKTQSMYL